MQRVTTDMILRSIKLEKKKHRTVFISKTANGKGVHISTLDPRTSEGAIHTLTPDIRVAENGALKEDS